MLKDPAVSSMLQKRDGKVRPEKTPASKGPAKNDDGIMLRMSNTTCVQPASEGNDNAIY